MFICKAPNPTFLSKSRCSPEEKNHNQIQKLFCKIPTNLLSSLSSSALGAATLGGDNTRHLGPLQLHGRNNLSLCQIRLIQGFTWLNHILILHKAEQSHRTMPDHTKGHMAHCLWHPGASQAPFAHPGGQVCPQMRSSKGLCHGCHWTQQISATNLMSKRSASPHPITWAKLLGWENTLILNHIPAKYRCNLASANFQLPWIAGAGLI